MQQEYDFSDPFEVKLTQSAKGFWYAERVTVRGPSKDLTMKRLDELTTAVKEKLNKLNGGA